MPKVIVNSTPLIALCGIGQLDILQKLYRDIYIPTAVYQEVTTVEDSACIQVMTAGRWIHVKQIQDVMEKKTAKYLGLTVTGTLGVLLKTKRQGIVEEIHPLLSKMKRNGFYIDPQLENMVVEQAGEKNRNTEDSGKIHKS